MERTTEKECKAWEVGEKVKTERQVSQNGPSGSCWGGGCWANEAGVPGLFSEAQSPPLAADIAPQLSHQRLHCHREDQHR